MTAPHWHVRMSRGDVVELLKDFNEDDAGLHIAFYTTRTSAERDSYWAVTPGWHYEPVECHGEHCGGAK